ncbi:MULTISPECIES: AAA family ATPase [unclassified Pseudomonas]|uniref:ExeA family protein n=1 Tax=unclassified Pseudomonas TaxID=196821 RepID=UPI002448C20A|nr:MULTISPECIES: AAA family ATPase [unclassified Pseudomonas]MDH0894387.1 AAA family ATPase [Pseudomonas sp. GD03875]MDH1063318.1 AAA family ATPase [Pseudomonas sp. GD03985]
MQQANTTRMKLKTVLWRLNISQSQLAASLEKDNGEPLSQSTIAQLVNHGQWPKTLSREPLERKIKELLFAKGANDEDIRDLFEMKETDAAVLAGRAASVPSNANSNESDYMLLRKNTLTGQAKAHFQLPRDPFTDEMQEEADVFLSDDIRYVRQAIRQTAKHGGMLAVVGESGAGKSTLRQDLVEWIIKTREPITVIEPYVLGVEDDNVKGKTLKALDITGAIIRCIDPSVKPRRSQEDRSRQMHELLLASAQAGRRHVVIIEEAHSLPITTLKHLKRFYELQAGFKKLLAFILVGQTELGDKLSEYNPAVREVVQRCELIRLKPLDNQVEAYLKHKFERIEVDYLSVFGPDAFDEIRNRLRMSVDVGRGRTRERETKSLCYPLAVNNLVSGAMNLAVRLHETKVTAALVVESLRDEVV